MNLDHVLLIGFGGPARREEIRPFLEVVAKGAHIPEARLREVEHHYEKIGGASPYHLCVLRLAEKLKIRLGGLKINLPIFLGMGNWHPFLKDTLAEIKQKGLKKGIGIVLAPHRSDASFWKYLRSVEDAKETAQARKIHYEYLRPWFDHPLFIEAEADQVRNVLNLLTPEEQRQTHLLFTAHSIPLAMASECGYAEEFQKSSALVSTELKHFKWSAGYQSRSGNPNDPWLEPDVSSELEKIKQSGSKTVMLVPMGFVCDNAEILYDLDIEARAAAEKAGLKYARAETVADHPTFVEMLAELIEEKLCES